MNNFLTKLGTIGDFWTSTNLRLPTPDGYLGDGSDVLRHNFMTASHFR